jgi:predicted DNA-binding transcriptional regulator AlpA
MSPDTLVDRLRTAANSSLPDQGDDLPRLLHELIGLLRRQAEAGPEPLTVPAAVAGPLCGVSEATWWRLRSAGKCPRPLKVGGKTLWRTAELRAWVAAGMPDRKTWEVLQGGRR